MGNEYALSRVKDALEQSAGNQLKAQRLLASWVEKDQTLLFGLVAPHMQGIITHAVAHVAAPVQKTAAPSPKKLDVQDKNLGEFGGVILASLRGQSAVTESFGEPTPKGISKPSEASKAHMDAIALLVQAGKDKQGKK
jgi:hypothetical protein